MPIRPLTLLPHPVGPGPGGLRLSATATRSGAVLDLAFALAGDLAGLVWPPPAPSEPADDLWRSTCFEAFLAAAGGGAYAEINLAPSTRWAAYRFSGYRAGMTALPIPAPRIAVARRPRRARLAARIDLDGRFPASEWRVGLSAVIETAGLSFWALAHPADRPDFHDRRGFVLVLEAAA